MEKFFPSAAKGRQAGLLEGLGNPSSEQAFAGLVVGVDIVFREVWSEVKRLHFEEFARFRRDAPGDLVRDGMHHVLGEVLDDQSGQWFRCRIDHYTDRAIRWTDCFVGPELQYKALLGLEPALDALVQTHPMPEELRIHDLTPRHVGGPYREAATARIPTDFHGWHFGSALPGVTAVVERMLRRGTSRGGEVRIHAWPLLLLRFAGREEQYVLFHDPTGELHLFTGAPPPE
jgi:hypothetical protein